MKYSEISVIQTVTFYACYACSLSHKNLVTYTDCHIADCHICRLSYIQMVTYSDGHKSDWTKAKLNKLDKNRITITVA